MATYVPGSITVLVAKSPSNLIGMFVSTNVGAGTVAIFDSGISTVYTPTVIQSFVPNISQCWYPFGGTYGIQCLNGINVSISASTMTWTAVFQ